MCTVVTSFVSETTHLYILVSIVLYAEELKPQPAWNGPKFAFTSKTLRWFDGLSRLPACSACPPCASFCVLMCRCTRWSGYRTCTRATAEPWRQTCRSTWAPTSPSPGWISRGASEYMRVMVSASAAHRCVRISGLTCRLEAVTRQWPHFALLISYSRGWSPDTRLLHVHVLHTNEHTHTRAQCDHRAPPP